MLDPSAKSKGLRGGSVAGGEKRQVIEKTNLSCHLKVARIDATTHLLNNNIRTLNSSRNLCTR